MSKLNDWVKVTAPFYDFQSVGHYVEEYLRPYVDPEEYKVICPYCGEKADLVPSVVVYPISVGVTHPFFWLCDACDAYTPALSKKRSYGPAGTLANASLRTKRRQVYAVYQNLQQYGSLSNQEVFKQFSRVLRLKHRGQCRISIFSEEQCDILLTKYSHLADLK